MKSNILNIFIVFLVFFESLLGQNIDNVKKNTVYLEIGGNNVFYSINYERMISKSISPRIGVSIMPITEYSNSGKHSNSKLFLTLMSNYFFDINDNNKIELGIGISYGLSTLFPATSIGYRFCPLDGGLVFKIAFTPLLDKEIFDIFPWFGIGIGYKY